jgi:hypothetical protein
MIRAHFPSSLFPLPSSLFPLPSSLFPLPSRCRLWLRKQSGALLVGSLACAVGCSQPAEISQAAEGAELRTSEFPLPVASETLASGIVDDPGNACPECLSSVSMAYEASSQSLLVHTEASINLQIRWEGMEIDAETVSGPTSTFRLPVKDGLVLAAQAVPSRLKFKIFGGTEEQPFQLDFHGCLAIEEGATVALDRDGCSAALATRPEIAEFLSLAEVELEGTLGGKSISVLGLTTKPDVHHDDEGGSTGGEE